MRAVEPAAPSHAPPAPFIVTAELPGEVFAWADGLRRAHFPPERNKLAAHVTLFHSLAPSLREELPRELARLAAAYAPPPARIDSLMDLGGGTALAIRSPQLLAVREEIAERFFTMLTTQDRGGKRLHITVQNKVERKVAQALQAELGPDLAARDFRFTGLGLHIYRNPFWESLGVWKFRGHQGA